MTGAVLVDAFEALPDGAANSDPGGLGWPAGGGSGGGGAPAKVLVGPLHASAFGHLAKRNTGGSSGVCCSWA